MNAISEFNHGLNVSINFKENEFKKEVDFLLKSTFKKLKKHKRACIIGAGKMNDFSLRFFVENFDEVVVTDIDLDTINQVISNLKFTKKNLAKVVVRQIEYTGFLEGLFFDDFKERIINARDFDKIDKIIQHKMSDIIHYQFLQKEFGSFDFVYVSPIYTQLVYQQVLRECAILRENGYPEHMIKYIENMILEEMVGVIDRFNRNLISLVDQNGLLFVLSDVFQLDVGSEFELRVSNGIRNRDVMEEIYEGYKKKYGMGLGDYGLYNLDELMITELSRWMIWKFTNKVKFAVKLKIYKKLNI